MFRFTIRELVLLTAIVAMGLGWRLHAIKHAALQRERELLRAKFDGVVRTTNDMAQIHIREMGDGINVRVPNGWQPPVVASSTP